MNREKNLVKNTAIISIGSFFPKFISVLLTPILTSKLSNAEYGSYDLLTTIAALLLPALTLQINAAAFRFLIDRREDEKDSAVIISTIFFFTIFVSFFACVLFYFVFGYKYNTTGIFVSSYLFLNIVLITSQQSVRGVGKNLQYSISAVLFSAVDTLFVAILLGVFGGDNSGLTGVFIAMIIASFVAIAYLIIRSKLFKSISISNFSIRKLKELLKYSWPIVPNNISDWVLRLSDRLVITGFLGVEANALYAAANRMPTIFSSFQMTFSLAWQENASIAAKDSDSNEYYSKMCNWVFSLLFGLLASLIAFTPFIWKLLIRGNYQEAYPQLPLLYLGMLFSCMAGTVGGIYVAYKKTVNAGISTILAAGLNLVIDLLFVMRIGIWAGSLSTMISYLVLLVYRMKNVNRFACIIFEYKKLIPGIIGLITMCICCYINSMESLIINFFLASVLIWFLDRGIIFDIFGKLFKKLRNRS